MTDAIKNYLYIYGRYIDAVTEANGRNKRRVFDALKAAGITAVTATFDGSGDSGQIEDMTAYGDTYAALPHIFVQTELVSHGSEVKTALYDCSLAEAIEDLCYGYLAQEHDGWENNDGAFGTFKLDVEQRTVDLEFNGHVIDHYTTTSSF